MIPVSPHWRDSQSVILEMNQVHVWRVQLDLSEAGMSEMAKFLSVHEKEKAGRFYFSRDRKHYIATHGALRKVLSLYVKEQPALLKFFTNTYGKPHLEQIAGMMPVPQFNISHSHDMALFAIVKEGMVGVDVERINSDFASMEIAQRFFSPSEVNALRSLHGNEQINGFFNCWTRKEAYIKAKGLGLSLPLNQFDVELVPGKTPRLVASEFCPQDVGMLSMFSFKAKEDFAGALVVEGTEIDVEYYTFGEKAGN